MARVDVYRDLMRKVADTPKVRAALRVHAQAVASRADQIAAAEAYEFNGRVEEGTRPRGRPFARVISYDADQEFGTWGKKRRRILGRAADIRE